MVFGWKPEGLAFDVSLHVGTAIAVLAFFWRDWIRLAREMILGIKEGKLLGNADRRLGVVFWSLAHCPPWWQDSLSKKPSKAVCGLR